MLLESLNPTVCNIIDIYDDDEIHNKTVSIEIISPAGNYAFLYCITWQSVI